MSNKIEDLDKEEDDFMKPEKKPITQKQKLVVAVALTVVGGIALWWNNAEFGHTVEKSEVSINTTPNTEKVTAALPRPPRRRSVETAKAPPLSSPRNDVSTVGHASFTDEEVRKMIDDAIADDKLRRGGQRADLSDKMLATDQARASGSLSAFNAEPNATATQTAAKESGRVSTLASMSFTLPIGSVIPCTLLTDVNTQTAGFANCVTTAPLYGADGLVALIEQGSTVTGSYLAGSGTDGVGRVVIAWERVRTPAGVLVDIPEGEKTAVGVGSLGAAGHKGEVDRRYMDRLKGAGMLSVFRLAMGAFSGSSEQASSNQTRPTPEIEGLMNTIIRDNILLPSIATLEHGAAIGIYLAEDIDFSAVYALEGE